LGVANLASFLPRQRFLEKIFGKALANVGKNAKLVGVWDICP
jgi:hypothetical protein